MAFADPGYKPLGFETDLSNMAFAGAMNPDELLHCEFYFHEPEDPNKSLAHFEKTGERRRFKGPKTIYVRIQRPGDKSSVIETPMRPEHQVRFPKQWRWFQIQEGIAEGGTENMPGWKIDEWDELNDDERHQLKYQRFYTVEQIAGASDAQVQAMGMGGQSLRTRAMAAVKGRATSAVREELDAKDKLIKDLADRLAKLEQNSPAAAQPVSPTAPPKVAEPAQSAGEPEKPKRTMSPEQKEKMRLGREAAAAKRKAS